MGIYHIAVAFLCIQHSMIRILGLLAKEPRQGFLTLNGRKASPLWDEEDQCLPPKKS